MKQEDYPLTLTTQDIMEILRVCRDKAYEIMRSKGFPVYISGRRKIVPRDPFFQWLERSATYSTEIETLISTTS